jgi:hypothetical protein
MRILRHRVFAALVLIACATALAAPDDSVRTLRSQSGQFVVRGLPVSVPLASSATQVQAESVRLDPAVLAIVCERIKHALLEELALPDNWRGSIQLNLHPYRHDNEQVQVTSVRFQNGWSYFLELPEVLPRARLLRAVVQALLSEIANRRSGERAAELPWWLIEGMPAYLQANDPGILTPQLATRISKRHLHEEPLKSVRELLRNRAALTLDELSWPSDQLLDGTDFDLFQACSQLFVHELLRLRDGRKCLGRMVLSAADHLNWQTTFLDAFKAPFPRLIDADKWWALTVAHLAVRDPMSVWPLPETLAQLRSILVTPVQTRTIATALPTASEVELHTVVAEWDATRCEPLLSQKLMQLQALRLRAAPQALAVLDGYLLALQQYLYGASKTSASKAEIIPPNRKTDLLRRITQLDALREGLESSPPPRKS